jgi:outer membrane immunogenic protein
MSFGNLTHLFYLEFTYNPLNGAMPETIGWLSKLQYADFSSSPTYGVYPLSGSEGNYWGSVRGRLGYAIDRTLLYVTGGLAGADIKHSVLNAGATTKNSGVEYGWTVGAGLEHAFTQNWSARVEYRYSDFGTSKWAANVNKADTTDHTVRVGLSYRFGGAARPVMARY